MFLLKRVDASLGRFFYKNSNLFSYNLYRTIYKKYICNLKMLSNKNISDYYQEGCCKIASANQLYIKNLNSLLSLQNSDQEKEHFYYEITSDILRLIKKIINENLIKNISLLEKYYNQKIVLTRIKIARNYHISDSKKESYSNFFHVDGYVYNMFKIFINLHDVTNEKGPFTWVIKGKEKLFVDKTKYKSRNNYIHSQDEECLKDIIKKNISKTGECFLCNTTELIHRAGNVKKNFFRDMIFLEFVASPEATPSCSLYKYEKNFLSKNIISRDLGKISGFINLFKYLTKCYYNSKSKSLNY